MRKIALLLLLNVAFGFAASRKVSRDLTSVPADPKVKVIVRYTRRPAAAQLAKIAQHGGKLEKALDLVRSSVYTLPAAALASLEKDPEVEYVSPDRPVSATLDYANPAINASIARQYGCAGRPLAATGKNAKRYSIACRKSWRNRHPSFTS